jgi:hypothetical protein
MTAIARRSSRSHCGTPGDSIRAFAGEDIEQAVFYPEDDRFLVERDVTVRHYEVVG